MSSRISPWRFWMRGVARTGGRWALLCLAPCLQACSLTDDYHVDSMAPGEGGAAGAPSLDTDGSGAQGDVGNVDNGASSAATGGGGDLGASGSTGGVAGTGGAAAEGDSGGTSAAGGVGGSGGESGAGGVGGVGGGMGAAGAPSGAECDGFSWQSACWRVGELGQSCSQTCAGHGGPVANLASWVGTAQQGGALESCQSVLQGLGITGAVRSGTRTDAGIGCHLWGTNQDPWWLRSPDFDVDARVATARLVCGCVD